MFALSVTAAFLIVAATAAVAKANLDLTYASNPYTIAATCNLAEPLVFLNVVVRNRGNAPSADSTSYTLSPAATASRPIRFMLLPWASWNFAEEGATAPA